MFPLRFLTQPERESQKAENLSRDFGIRLQAVGGHGSVKVFDGAQF
jgi:hypothetical protein